MFTQITRRYKDFVVLLGDIGLFFASLALTVAIRYESPNFAETFYGNLHTFTLLLVIWVIIFYIADLYTYTSFRNTLENGQRYFTAVLSSFFVSITIFYIFGQFFSRTPKLILIIFTLVFGTLDCLWRLFISRKISKKQNQSTVLLLSSSHLIETITKQCEENPQLGYSIISCTSVDEAEKMIGTHAKNSIIVVDTEFLKNEKISKILYKILNTTEIKTLARFYEQLFQRVPLSEIEETWFIQEVKSGKIFYDFVKRIVDTVLSIFGLIILSPICLILLVLIPATSKGNPFYSQIRTGKNDAPFRLYKFRTMYSTPDKNPDSSGLSPVWSGQNDPRVTPLGKLLRASHLDETPQLVNILIGDLSFVGPRPERPTFIETLKEQIPYYMIRHTLTPGLTGWAQVKYQYTNSIEDTKNKLEYDIYYLKNRNLMMDVFIILKTFRSFF